METDPYTCPACLSRKAYLATCPTCGRTEAEAIESREADERR